MPGIFGGLPPGLRGYVAAEEMAQQRGMNELGMAGGILGLQGQLQQQQMAQQQQQRLQDFALSLPEAERGKFLVAPSQYIQELTKRHVVGDALVTGGGQQTYQAPPKMQIAPTGQVYNPRDLVPGQVFSDPNKPFQPGAGGVPVPNVPFQNYELQKAQAGRPQVQTQVNVPPASQIFQNESKLRDDYVTASKPFVGLRDAYNTVQASLSGPITAASTLAGATKFMKLIDPESVVRESELQLALKATGMLDRFLNLHNTVAKGQVLTPNQAKEIKDIADVLYKAAEKQQGQTDKYFSGLATQYGLSPQRVIRNQKAVMANPNAIFDAADAIVGD
jgi:hypothetical protein